MCNFILNIIKPKGNGWTRSYNNGKTSVRRSAYKKCLLRRVINIENNVDAAILRMNAKLIEKRERQQAWNRLSDFVRIHGDGQAVEMIVDRYPVN